MYEETIAQMQITAPAARSPRLAALLEAVNADAQLKAWWYAQQVNAERLQMSDHSWIHVQIVVNIALRLFRLLNRRGLEPSIVTDYGLELRDAKSPHWTGARNSPRTFGHFGRSGTFLWVDPEPGVALACLTDLTFGEWAVEAWPALSDAVVAELAG